MTKWACGGIAASMVILAAACGGGGASTGGGATVPTTIGPASKQLVDYKTPLIAPAVGQYSGQCSSDATGNPPIDAQVTIHPNGNLTLAPGGTAALSTSLTSIGWSRNFDPDDNSVYGFFASHEFGFNAPPTGVAFRQGADGPFMSAELPHQKLFCRKVNSAQALLDKSSYQVGAQFLDAAKTALKCIDGINRTDLGLQSYQIQAGQVQILGDSFSLLGPIRRETLYIMGVPIEKAHLTSLTYIVQLTDGKELTVILDQYGDLASLTYRRGPDHLALCGPAK